MCSWWQWSLWRALCCREGSQDITRQADALMLPLHTITAGVTIAVAKRYHNAAHSSTKVSWVVSLWALQVMLAAGWRAG